MTIKEKLDLITEDTWIISDTHIGHGNASKGILKFEPSRLEQMRKDGFSEDQHSEWIIHNWNKTVKPDEIVLHLGDFAFSGVADYLEKLNGLIIIALGNHDGRPTDNKLNNANPIDGFYIEDRNLVTRVEGFTDPMFSGFVKEFRNKKYLFSHYPVFNIDEWDAKNKMIAPRIKKLEEIYKLLECDFNVHGHLHSNVCTFENSINASFEQIEFKPIKLKDLLDKKDK